jgi:hypothetical protein
MYTHIMYLKRCYLVSTMKMRPDSSAGSTRCERCTVGSEHEEQAFQPLWWSSSPTVCFIVINRF